MEDWHMKLKSLQWGVLAGLMGGLAGALILWGSWLLPALGLLLTKVDLLRGFAVMLVLGSIGGGLYGLAAQKLSGRLYVTVISGLILGVLLWVLGVQPLEFKRFPLY
jgi:hypothetical protein